MNHITIKQLCHNCLSSCHRESECKSAYTFLICREKHDTMIHHNGLKEIPVITTHINSIVARDVVNAGLPVLRTIINKDQTNKIGMLVDTTAQSSIITKETVQKINVKHTS
jgi:hypothetical protein